MFHNEFRKIGIEVPLGARGKKKVVCPKCSGRKGGTKDRDLSVDLDNGLYKCHSAKCDFQGSVRRLKKQYSRPQKRNVTTLANKAVQYFQGRGIGQKTLTILGITTDTKGNTEFNYYRGEELINIKTRFNLSNGKKSFKQHSGAEKIVYNLNSLQGKRKGIFVEGEMDVASFVEAGLSSEYGIISVDQGAGQKGSNLDGKLECIRNCADAINHIEEWYICTDKDEAGEYLQEELIRRLGSHKCKIVSLPKGRKDANEVLKNGANSHDARCETLRNAVRNAAQVPVPGIHVLDADVMAEMEYEYDNGKEKGKTTHIPKLDKHFTFLTGDVTLITGIPNDGKSQFTRFLMLIKAKIDNWKWACFVPEDFPAKFFFEDMCHIFLGKTTDKDYLKRATKEEYIQAMLFVREHFFLIYPEIDKQTGQIPLPSNKWVNEKINFLKLKHGVNAYVKDPWNKIYHNIIGREDLYLVSELSKEKFFASQFDAALYIVHPRTMRRGKDGKIQEVGPYDLSGGAMFFNMMDNILLVSRPNRWDNPTDTMVNVTSKKIKKQKLVGKIGTADLWFDVAKMRYYEQVTDYCPLEEVIQDDENIDEFSPAYDDNGEPLPF